MTTMLSDSLQQPSGTAPRAPDDRATDFKAVEGDTGEHFSGYTLMVEAYAAIWLILLGWLVLMWRKQSDLTSRVDGLEAAIARAEQKVAPKPKPSADKPAEKAKAAEESA
jgi:hypothetical protein